MQGRLIGQLRSGTLKVMPQDNPYQPNPDSLESHRRRVQHERLVTLQDDSARPPATLGLQPWQSMILGPSSGQPSKASRDIKPGWGKRILRVAFWIWATLFLVATIRILLN